MDVEQESQILQYEVRLLDAMKNSNVEVLEQLVDQHLTFVIPGGQVVSKEDDLSHYRAGNMNITHIETKDYQIKDLGDMIVVTVTILLKGSFLEFKLDGTYQFLRVWKKSENGWTVVAGSSMPKAE